MSTGVAHRKTVGIGIKDFCLVRAETSELQPAITQPFGGGSIGSTCLRGCVKREVAR